MSPQEIVQATIAASDRWAIYGALIGAFAAIIGGLLAGGVPIFISWWLRPILKIEFDDSKPLFIVDKDFDEAGKRVFRRYVTAKLINNGATTANNCRVYLKSIQSVHNNGVTKPTEFDGAFQLAWPGWQFDGRQLPPGLRIPVELVSVDKSNEGWLFMFKGAWPDPESMRTFKGIYRFCLVAIGDNAGKCTRIIDVEYHGKWDDLRATCVR